MTFENVPLPFEKVKPEELTGQQLVDAVTKGIDPSTGAADVGLGESLRDIVYWGYRSRSHTPLGSFEEVAEWSGGDGHPMGRVVRHVESDTYLMAEGTYSSWDSSDYDTLVVAEPYQFVETRYREV